MSNTFRTRLNALAQDFGRDVFQTIRDAQLANVLATSNDNEPPAPRPGRPRSTRAPEA
jgi:hypothetical protein